MKEEPIKSPYDDLLRGKFVGGAIGKGQMKLITNIIGSKKVAVIALTEDQEMSTVASIGIRPQILKKFLTLIAKRLPDNLEDESGEDATRDIII